MQKAYTILISVFILAMLVVPALSLAQDGTGLIPCGQADSSGVISKENSCDFKDFMHLIHNVITFVLVKLALPIAAIMFVYAGFKLVTSGGSTEARGTAKRVFINTALGLIFAAGAWLIVSTLLSILGYEGAWIGLKIMP